MTRPRAHAGKDAMISGHGIRKIGQNLPHLELIALTIEPGDYDRSRPW